MIGSQKRNMKKLVQDRVRTRDLSAFRISGWRSNHCATSQQPGAARLLLILENNVLGSIEPNVPNFVILNVVRSYLAVIGLDPVRTRTWNGLTKVIILATL